LLPIQAALFQGEAGGFHGKARAFHGGECSQVGGMGSFQGKARAFHGEARPFHGKAPAFHGEARDFHEGERAFLGKMRFDKLKICGRPFDKLGVAATVRSSRFQIPSSKKGIKVVTSSCPDLQFENCLGFLWFVIRGMSSPSAIRPKANGKHWKARLGY
jgi:hypothetical protein